MSDGGWVAQKHVVCRARNAHWGQGLRQGVAASSTTSCAACVGRCAHEQQLIAASNPGSLRVHTTAMRMGWTCAKFPVEESPVFTRYLGLLIITHSSMTMASFTPLTNAGGMLPWGALPPGPSCMALTNPSGSSQQAPTKRTTWGGLAWEAREAGRVGRRARQNKQAKARGGVRKTHWNFETAPKEHCTWYQGQPLLKST